MALSISTRADDAVKHSADVTTLLFHKGILYSGGDDGWIKAWSPDLTKIAEAKAHPTSVYGLAASNDSLYSASNDGTIRSWELSNLRTKATVFNDDKVEILKIRYVDGVLYAGDNEGNLKVFKDDKIVGFVNMAEPINDFLVSRNVAFTVKDTDVSVTELKIAGDQVQYGQITSFWGRPPLALVGERLVAFVTREGKDILLHDNNHDTKYEEIAKVPAAHEMVINALSGIKWNNQEYLFSGGWDKVIKRWKIEKNTVTADGTANVDIVINAITTGEPGEVYAAGGDGHIVRLCVN